MHHTITNIIKINKSILDVNMILLKLVMFTIKKNQRNLKLKDEMYFSKNLTKDIVKNIKGHNHHY